MFDAPAPPPDPTPVVHVSQATTPALTSASLAQDGIKFKLVITTRGSYRPAKHRELCLDLVYGQPRQKTGLCVGISDGRLVLRRDSPAPAIVATVTRKARTLTAKFTPVEAGLPFGPFRWSVRSRWNHGADALPRRGTFAARARLLREPECFGAAARDARAPCTNPALRKVATPTPEEALLIPGAPCTVPEATPILGPCHFGVAPSEASGGWVALVGDSHAEHWRAALDVVAQAKRWHVVAMTRGGCPLSDTPVAHFPALQVAQCESFNVAARAWLAAHPEVHTVFAAAHDLNQFAGDPVPGYRSAWRSLAPNVQQINVIRENPSRVHLDTTACVERLLQARQAIGSRCAEPRLFALPPDPEAEAALAPGDPRVRLIDLTEFMCMATECPPVIGGVLVLRDDDHLTRAFSTTLGPYLLRALG